jgi:hypothetical protein
MDDIDQDIERARRGKKRETAYEIMKHPKIPATNLPPLPFKGKLDLSKPEIIPKRDWCEFRIDMRGEGIPYGKSATNYCRLCGKQLCFEHHLPEDHNCPMVSY